MGDIQHRALIVTCHGDQSGDAVAARLMANGGRVIGAASEWNGCRTFVVLPSGSKEHWPENGVHARRIEASVAWLRAETEAAGFPEWVVVEYGEHGPRIVHSHDFLGALDSPADRAEWIGAQ